MHILDLTQLAAKLYRQRRHLPLANAIEQMKGAAAAKNDLNMAARFLAAGEGVASAPIGSIVKSATVGDDALSGLASYTIILYASATDDTSGNRRKCDVAARYKGDDRAVHERLCTLRNNAVAHYGPGYSTTSPWSRDAVTLRVTAEGNTLAFPYYRTGHRESVFKDLARMIPKAQQIVDEIGDERMGKFWPVLERALDGDEELRNLLRNTVFDPVSFFGDESAADQYRKHVSGNDPDFEKAGYLIKREGRPA